MKRTTQLLSIVTAVACALNTYAQNTSYSANAIPIGGYNNCAFGQGALFSTTGSRNAAIGFESLRSNTNGNNNTAAGFLSLTSNTGGGANTAVGAYAMRYNTTGTFNVGIGLDALNLNTTGNNNVGIGSMALRSNTTGYENVANGAEVLYSNTTGSYNSASGYRALYTNTIGGRNVANGTEALHSNTSASYNTANGYRALYANTTGLNNIAEGYWAMFENTSGGNNTATGGFTLRNNTTGSFNSAIGNTALYGNTTGIQNTAMGSNCMVGNTTGNCNTAIGNEANVSTGSLNNATAIGCKTVVNASDKVRIGNTAVTVIEGQVAYSYPSDSRFKTNIKEEDVKGLEFIKKLRPVVYNFDTRKFTEFLTKNMSEEARQRYLDKDFRASTKIRQSGFIAQEVEKAAKEVQYDFNGVHVPANAEEENYSIAYSEFVVPLVKGMQEQQKIIETLQQQVNELLKQKTSPTTGLEEAIAVGASLEQNVPNPFTYETVIGFNLPQSVSNASLVVYDLSGKQLKSLPIQQRGNTSMIITADQLAAGMYIYSIVADGKILSSKRMVVAEK